MNFRRMIIFGACTFLFTSCTGRSAPVPEQASPVAAVLKLYSLRFDGREEPWTRSTPPYANIIDFKWPQKDFNANGVKIDHEKFTVRAIAPETCTKEYADKKLEKSWGSTVPKEAVATPFVLQLGNSGPEVLLGYTWLSQDLGKNPLKPTTPTHHHWCIHQDSAAAGMDIDIHAWEFDPVSINFVQRNFIPVWLDEKAFWNNDE